MCWSYSLALQLKGFFVLDSQEIGETRALHIGLHKSEKIPHHARYLHNDLNIFVVKAFPIMVSSDLE
jgi:hypothetical protein